MPSISPLAAHDRSSPPTAIPHADIAIMGGGLAGMTLALQLRQAIPEREILVLERRSHPVPAACHKVGESSVEIGAHYFEHVLGLSAHLQKAQLRKFGFRFFFSEGRRDIHAVTELGASRSLQVPSYQIDRGLFENFLGEECRRRGIHFLSDARVSSFDLATADAPHMLRWKTGEGPSTTEYQTQCRWLVDASGRIGLIRRRLKLDRPNKHAAHAVWFRIKGHINIDTWGGDTPEVHSWRARCDRPDRWLSTNHLVGPGYWVWLIPLASGSHSVGIVADPRLQPLEEMDTFENAMQWLSIHQPALFDALDARRKDLQDFAFFRRFSYDCEQVFSTDRWALTGEAGRFLDPFYSPGSDFIAMGNTYITDLIQRDFDGQRIQARTQIYEQVFRSFYDSTLTLYQDQYALFGDPEVLPCKIIWDYTYYWSVLAQFFCQGRLTDLALMSRLREDMMAMQQLNAQVQAFLRDWGTVSSRRNAAVMHDQASVPWFADLNASLQRPHSLEEFESSIRQARHRLEALAQQIVERALGEQDALDASGVTELLPPMIGCDGNWPDLLFPAPTGKVQEEPVAA